MASLAATLLEYYNEEETFIRLVRIWTVPSLDKLFESGLSGLMAPSDEFQSSGSLLVIMLLLSLSDRGNALRIRVGGTGHAAVDCLARKQLCEENIGIDTKLSLNGH